MAQLSALIAKYKRHTVSTMRLSCAVLTSKTDSRTPVAEGDLRASWTPNNGQPIARNVYVSAGESPSRNDSAQVINSLKVGDTYSYANGQPYARRIEYEGWSLQAPAGMLRVSTAEWDAIVRASARRGS